MESVASLGSFYLIVGSLSIVLGSWWLFRRNNNTSNKPTIRQIPAPVPNYFERTIDCTHDGLVSEMKRTWEKPTHKLPVAVDLPRLARKTIIMDNDNLLLDGTTSEYEFIEGREEEIRANLVQDVWTTVSILVGEENPSIYSNLAEKLKGGDMSFHLSTFIQSHYTEDSRVIRLLKVCNQSMLAPTVIRMKDRISSTWPYKDQRGEWIILIQKEKDNSVSVTHKRKEVSYESTKLYDEQHFQFSWELKMNFDNEIKEMQKVSVCVTGMTFVDTVTKDRKKEIIETFNSTEFMDHFEIPL